jgi:hypothetical protein
MFEHARVCPAGKHITVLAPLQPHTPDAQSASPQHGPPFGCWHVLTYDESGKHTVVPVSPGHPQRLELHCEAVVHGSNAAPRHVGLVPAATHVPQAHVLLAHSSF